MHFFHKVSVSGKPKIEMVSHSIFRGFLNCFCSNMIPNNNIDCYIKIKNVSAYFNNYFNFKTVAKLTNSKYSNGNTIKTILFASGKMYKGSHNQHENSIGILNSNDNTLSN